ncbi:MAG: DUF4147 domain-containing protein [Phycisphaerales bacterium]|nr:DUF4147 domain-containing protein [Phycisphaerales bacterium]
MPDIRYQPDLDHASRTLPSEIINAVLQAVDPHAAMHSHFDKATINAPTHILAMGKASIPMTNTAIECLGDRFARATVISTPTLVAQSQFKNKFVELLAGDHPLPSQRSIDATALLIEHAKSIPADHQALVLISGGASALLCSPRDGVTLEEIIDTTDTLLRSGASIQEINEARSKLDSLKAGGLGRMLSHVIRTDAYVLSDVIGDDLNTIASGPTNIPTINHTIIANNQTALDALVACSAINQINMTHTQRDAVGFATDEAARITTILNDSTQATPTAVCLGGEPTVDTAGSTGNGGPMLELALSCALNLAESDYRWTVIAFATDGIDGPTDAAGAIITSEMLRDPTLLANAQTALDEHNSLPICDTLGATIRTGPTGTNVNDISIVIRWD